MTSNYTVPAGGFHSVLPTDNYETVYISANAGVLNVLGGSVQTFSFLDNSGRLTTLGPPYWTGSIQGFQAGDLLTVEDLGNWASTHYDDVSQTLNFLDSSGSNTGYVHIAEPSPGYFSDANISAIGSTFSGFATITTSVPCFVLGTRILTPHGEVPVERLAVGDKVTTISGAARPIVWIGFGRSLVTRANRLAQPVVVRRGALADNVPSRDLYLTHGHALYCDGVLIAVEHLVNHRSIAWDDTARVVEYFHIELDEHDVLLANGAPAESYYEASNRAFFQNTRTGSQPGGAMPACAPVVTNGEIVETVWAALFERAGGQVHRNTTDDADLHLVVDGERLDPTATTDDGVYTFELEGSPPATLRLCSHSGVPSLLGLGRSDHRPLGVAIRQIILYHAGIPSRFDYDGPQFREGGCHLPEGGYCWTDGEFELPARFFTHLNGAFTLVVYTQPHYDMRYPISALLTQAA